MLASDKPIVPLVSAADLTGKEGYFVTAAGALAGTNAPFGVVLEGFGIGIPNSVAVCAGGQHVRVKLAADTAIGTKVGSDSNSLASSSATLKCAITTEAGLANELVSAVTFLAV